MNKILKFLLIFVLLIISGIVYSRYIGTYGLITKEYPVYNSNLPDSFDGLKIVHFSDIHYNRAIDINKIKDIVEEINFINPDIVVFTGDLIDKDVELTNKDYLDLINELSKINSKYGKYAVMGNHDFNDYDNVLKVYVESNFIYLENNYDIITSKYNEKIMISGLGNVSNNIDDVDYFINNTDDINYKIMLVHEPDITDKLININNLELVLAGHSHNGQVRIPFIGKIITPKGSIKYYDEYYKVSNTDLYISSGIGVSTLNYRLFNHPSINFYRMYK